MLAISVKDVAYAVAQKQLCECFLLAAGIKAGLAQLVEHLICNQGVVGSSPITGTSLFNNLVEMCCIPRLSLGSLL
jgi:hypothetical protein